MLYGLYLFPSYDMKGICLFFILLEVTFVTLNSFSITLYIIPMIILLLKYYYDTRL